MSDFDVDVSGLDQAVQRFSAFAQGKWRRAFLANVAEEAIELIREGFSSETDPYGAKWAELKSRSGRILQDTGGMRNSFHRTSLSDTETTVGAGKDYARYHQDGTSGRKFDSSRFQVVNRNGRFKSKAKAAKAKRSVLVRQLNFKAGGGAIPARKMVPDSYIPSEWSDRIEAIAELAIKHAFG